MNVFEKQDEKRRQKRLRRGWHSIDKKIHNFILQSTLHVKWFVFNEYEQKLKFQLCFNSNELTGYLTGKMANPNIANPSVEVMQQHLKTFTEEFLDEVKRFDRSLYRLFKKNLTWKKKPDYLTGAYNSATIEVMFIEIDDYPKKKADERRIDEDDDPDIKESRLFYKTLLTSMIFMVLTAATTSFFNNLWIKDDCVVSEQPKQ